MRIINNNQQFLQLNIFGLTVDMPKNGCEQRYKKYWLMGMYNIPFTKKILFFDMSKKFSFRFSIFDALNKMKLLTGSKDEN